MAVAIAERFSADQLSSMRELASSKKAGVGDVVGALLVGGGIPVLSAAWLIGIVAIIAGFIVFARFSKSAERERTKKHLKAHDDLKRWWDAAVAGSDPASTIELPISLRGDERPLFCDAARRYAERNIGANVDLQSSSAGTGGAVAVGGVVLGSGGSTGYTHGTITQVYGNACVDSGALIVTDQRVPFLGAQNTIEVPRAS